MKNYFWLKNKVDPRFAEPEAYRISEAPFKK